MSDPRRVWRRPLTFFIGVAGALLLAVGCSAPSSGPPDAIVAEPPLVRMLTGPATGVYLPLGKALAAIYNVRLPGIRVLAIPAEGPAGAASNAQDLEAGRVDLAFSRADLAFQVFRQSSEGTQVSTSHLRSIAVLYSNVVHLMVHRGSGIHRGEDMRGHRMQASEENYGATLMRSVVEAHGFGLKDMHILARSGYALDRLKSGEVDVRIFASAYPLPGVDDVGEHGSTALLSLSPAVIDRLRSDVPFFKPAVIPAGTYKGQTEDVQTVGIDGLLLCRDTMDEATVYALTKTLFEALPELSRTQNSARMISAVKAPATPVPLHPGAARYYRERDLFR